jgi:two-component system, chemotaxis family, sensor kinase CheA
MTDQSASAHKAVMDFLAEAEDISNQLGSELADLADMAESGEVNPDLVNSIFRGAHSLKGLAGMFGFNDVSGLSHSLESLLDRLRLGKIDLDQAVIKLLFQAHELLNALIRGISKGGETAHRVEIADCVTRLNEFLPPAAMHRTAYSLDQLGLPERIVKALTEYEEYRLLDTLDRGKNLYTLHTSLELTSFDLDLTRLSDLLKNSGEVISTLPGISSSELHIDFSILYGTFLSIDDVLTIVANECIEIACEQVSVATVSPVSLPRINRSPRTDDVQQPVSMRVTPESPSFGGELPSAKSLSHSVRVDIGKMDELMNIVGELALVQSSISAIANRMRNEGFSRLAVDLGKASKLLDRKLSDLQKGVLEIRMIPVGQLYEKMARIVRKISREQGKKVELKFFGADTELDKLIVEDISDPMMHIIRNAIDHGIEMPEQRIALGKDEKGTISISAFQKGSHVVIAIEDDGNGIDIERVKANALQKGLVQDVVNVSDKEALEYIFLPGFSTTDTVSEVSGRGVGMDVVRNNIASISGMVDIETRKGRGACFSITLPITLAIIKALIISCAGRTYALPITSIRESLLVTEEEIATVERREVIQVRESTLPLLRLDAFFAINRQSARPDEFYVVVVGSAEKRIGIVVDTLLGQQDIVIKSLGDAFKGFRGISGAADLGDRGTILVLDVGGMLAEAMKSGA